MFFRRSTIPVFCLIIMFGLYGVPADAQQNDRAFAYPVKFLCGPSSEAFQEGIVAGYAMTAVNVLNPSDEPVSFAKRVSRALPYQQEGAQSAVRQDTLGPLGAMEIECNEIRQMLPSQMTEEFRTGYLLLRAAGPLVVTVVYSARPRDGEISTIEVQQIAAIEIGGGGGGQQFPDLTISDIDIGNLTVRCPNGQGSCRHRVPVTVSNIGAADAGPFTVRTNLDPGQSQQVTQSFPGLAAGASQTFNVDTPAGDNCFDPDCLVCALADSGMTVAESDETNNQLCEERQG
jgi:hypothetical protein